MQAILALENGSVYRGRAIGDVGQVVGEVVFNTAVTGYQEILSDPSYRRQIVVFTQPHVGNTGANPQDEECVEVHAAGLAVRALHRRPSSWRSRDSLQNWLAQRRTSGIAGIDTRSVTRTLREQGALRGCLVTGPTGAMGDGLDEATAVQAARDWPGLQGMDLTGEVTAAAAYDWERRADAGFVLDPAPSRGEAGRVIAYDFGIKRNILRILASFGCRVTVVPANTPAREVLSERPDGVFLSNGPGDPAACTGAIEAARELLAARVPLFGICLGHQLLALAAGARTMKLKFGHHGANHPVQDLETGRVLITSQNHGFAVEEASLPQALRATHRSLFDGTLQGLRHTEAPAFGFQGHPEASPGPHDACTLFSRFIDLLRVRGNTA